MSKSFAMMKSPTIEPETTNKPPENHASYRIDTQPFVIGDKLNGENYHLWAVLMRKAINGRGMEPHITRVPPPPPRTDPTYAQWLQADNCVFTWIPQNIESRLVSRVSQQPTTRYVWDALAVTYASGGDKIQIYDMHMKASMVKQGNNSLEETWSVLQELWISFDKKRTNPMKYPEDMEIHDQFIQE
ncbi:uncharacterized protein LOC121791113 [Salvia splendens]|uniref:uncharacterized protein LOC121791113 n=1 Tax=Salvia splendens TaxID=180675 RepID=UPI001C266531|nr:uncharacterized protein LOC121791113 [Salvia splendens]